jgi:hypothetical protein
MLADAAGVGSAASLSRLAVKKAARTIYVLASVRRKLFPRQAGRIRKLFAKECTKTSFDSETFNHAMNLLFR